ncbi:MAG: 2'-5' RNA ligase [Candidatus Woesearchaeota archaeon]|jgi:2'-5' RNA ligase
MRLFIAAELSDEFLAIQSKLPQLSFPKYTHITLKFLGDVTKEELATILSKLRTLKQQNISLETQEALGFFPNEKNIKSIHIPIKSKSLSLLQKHLDHLLADIFQKEKNFVPHITVARAKRELISKEISTLQSIILEKKKVTGIPVYLFESTGPVYKKIKKLF